MVWRDPYNKFEIIGIVNPFSVSAPALADQLALHYMPSRVAAGLLVAAMIPFAASTNPPAIWPTFRHDVQHSGRSNQPGPVDAAFTVNWTLSTGGPVRAPPVVRTLHGVVMQCAH